jgi:hypothetical protein
MHKNATKCNKTQSKWCKNKHGASKIIDMFETYHLFPEFTGVRLHDHPEGELQWLVVASVCGKMGDPTSMLIEFEIMENSWADGLARGIQEMLARLCGHHVEEIKGFRFQHYARRDDTGRPMEMPPLHHKLRHHVDHLDFPKSYLPQIRGSSWHNNKIKRIRSGYYSSNNFQDSNKRKKY